MLCKHTEIWWSKSREVKSRCNPTQSHGIDRLRQCVVEACAAELGAEKGLAQVLQNSSIAMNGTCAPHMGDSSVLYN